MLAKLENILLFLTIFFLPTQLGKHFWPEFSSVYSLPVDYLSPTIYLWDILTLLLWIIFLLQGKHINRLALNLFYFFILTQSLSLLSFNSNIGPGLVRLEQYTISGLFGVYVASLNFKSIRPKLFWPLSLSLVLQSVLGLTQFIKGGTAGLWILGERTFSITSAAIAKFDFYGVEFLRPYATFPHPNVLAGFLVISSMLLTKLLPVSTLASLFLKATSSLAAVVVLLTVSRTAIVAGFVYLLARKKNWIWSGLILLILLPVLFTRFSSLIDYDNLTFVRRQELSKIALNLWFKGPKELILGVGLNNFIPSAADLLLVGPGRFLQPVHNIFLLTLSETGIIGLIGLLGFLRFRRRYLLIWLLIIFLGLFDHYLLTLPQGYRLLFLVWGLSLLE